MTNNAAYMRLFLRSILFSLLLSTMLSSCTVGPNFKSPAAPPTDHYEEEQSLTSPLTATDQIGPHLNTTLDVSSHWWQVFHSQALDQLVEKALRNNPDLQAAQAALRAAQENYLAQRGSYFPVAQADYARTRQKDAVGTLSPVLNGADAPTIYTLHTAQLNVSYLLDVFGGNRRQVETAQASADYERFQFEAAYLTLSSNVVVAAIQEASLREQLAATRDIVNTQQTTLDIMKHQLDVGAIAGSDVAIQRALLATTRTALPQLEKQLAQQRDLLKILCGQLPDEQLTDEFSLDDLTLPEELPLSVPAKLVKQRPDIRAAEAQLHVATAQVGVAIADMLPQISLSASYGGVSTQFNDLFKGTNKFWSAGTNLSQVIFSGGTLLHRKRAADSMLDQAGAQYRSTVLSAFQNVADTLHALKFDTDTLLAQQEAEQASQDSLKAATKNLELGITSSIVVLNAEQAYRQAHFSLVQMRAQRYSDAVALFQSLGGGWWNRQ